MRKKIARTYGPENRLIRKADVTNQVGFTLMELIAVIVIFSVLGAMLVIWVEDDPNESCGEIRFGPGGEKVYIKRTKSTETHPGHWSM